MSLDFKILATDANARLGRIRLPRATVSTPAFMPVGTAAAVKTVTASEVRASGSEIILGNTFHLSLRPGVDIIARHGGLHEFMRWDGPILTDSGGFQVWSLAKPKDIGESGVIFHSPFDGSRVFMGPDESIAVQQQLGSDIAMVFDECTRYPATFDEARTSMLRSLRWTQRCRDIHRGEDQALFGIAQGGLYEELRIEALEALAAMQFDGYALGGLSVGEKSQDMHHLLSRVAPRMPPLAPRYLMGVGKPENLLAGVAAGIDLFDCVLPTRNARNGWLYTHSGIVRLKNAINREDMAAVESDCPCITCQEYSRSYLRHLYSSGEMLGPRLGTIHNLHFFQRLMTSIRTAIELQRLQEFIDDFLGRYGADGRPMA